MNPGKLNVRIDIVQQTKVLDGCGFATETDIVVASVWACREGRHGSRKWANMAAFSEATDLFCFRVIPGVRVTTAMSIVYDGRRFEITSVDKKDRGAYVEVLAKEVKPGG